MSFLCFDFVFNKRADGGEFFFTSDDGGVWSGVGEDEEEGFFGGLGGEVGEGCLSVEFEIVIGAGMEFVFWKGDFLGVFIDEFWVAEVSVFVVSGAVEKIEASFEDAFRGLGVTGDAGFSDHGGVVSGGFGNFSDSEFVFGDGEFAVATDGGVAVVFACHEGATGRVANGGAGVVAGEADAVGGELVDVWGGEIFLTVGGDVVVTQVIGDDVDDVGFRGKRGDEEEAEC